MAGDLAMLAISAGSRVRGSRDRRFA